MQQESGAGISGVSPTDDQVMGQEDQQNRSTINSNVDDQALKCPRCDSPNTKFCYYNNYNLTQPRHFCKTCRRYWTKGGALRNVPIGGGCRKNKRSKQRPKDQNPLTPIDQDTASPTSINGLSLLHNLWATQPATSSSHLGLDLPSSDRFNFAFAKLQNHSSFLGQPNNNNISGSNIPIMSHVMKPASIKANGVGDPSGGHMRTLFQTPALQTTPLMAPPPPPSSSSSMDGTGSVSFGLQSLSNATDHWHWRMQQQRLGMGLADQGQNMDGNNLFLPNVPNNDHRYSISNLQHQHIKGRPVVPNDLLSQVYDNRPVSEWQTVAADNLLEPVPVESNYWNDMQMM